MVRFEPLGKFWQGFTGRMLLGVLAIHLLLVPLFFFGVLLIYEQTFQTQFIDRIRNDARLYAAIIEQDLATDNVQTNIILHLDEALLSGGIIFADFTNRQNLTLLPDAAFPQLHLTFTENFFFGQHDDNIYFIAVPVIDNMTGENLGELRLGFDEQPTIDSIALAYQRGASIAVAYVLLSSLFVLFFGRRLTKPISKLQDLARSIAAGSHAVDMQVSTGILEIKHLASDLERMRLALIHQHHEVIDRELRLHTIMDNVGEGIILLDKDGVIHSFNRASEKMFDWNADKIIGNKISLLIASDANLIHNFLAQATNSTGITFEIPGLQKNGRQFPMEVTINEVQLRNGLFFTVIAHDISARKQSELALKESEARFRNAFEFSAIGMALVTREYEILEVNQVLCNMLGYSEVELISQSFIDLTHQDDIGKSTALLQQLFNAEIDSYDFEKRYIHKQGQAIWAQLNVSLLRNKDSQQSYAIAQIQDITIAKALSEKLAYQAHYDELTGLVNRRAFNTRLENILVTISNEQTDNALCYMDLDQFKIVNDTSGHIAGDELLKQLASILQIHIRKTDTLARLGGDEFGILMEKCTLDKAIRVTDIIHQAVTDFHFNWEGKIFNIGISIGLVPLNSASGTITDVLKQADAACYAAKDAGRNRTHVYHVNDQLLALRHGEMQWLTRINQALKDNRFYLVYQPIVALDNRHNEGEYYELLLRMTGDANETIYPGAFLSAAERYDLTPTLDRWVINTAFNWLAKHPQRLNCLYQCSINLSGQSLVEEDLLAFIIQQLEYYRIPTNKICFEITETAAISNLNSAISFINKLKDHGCKFALDDFGSGLSSFAYLKNLPVDFLKIDGQFVKDILSDPVDFELVRSINEIGHVLGKKTIAEFVENQEIFDKLKEIGVDYAQGYGVGKPRRLS